MQEQLERWAADARRAVSPGGAGTGREVAAWLEVGYRAAEWWDGYADRLTPIERARIVNGDLRPFYRPWAPNLREDAPAKDEWAIEGRRPIPADLNRRDNGGHRLWVSVKVTPHLGRHRVTVLRVRDFRAPHTESVRWRRTSEALDEPATLYPLVRRMGEPEGADLSEGWKLAGRARRMQAHREAITT